MRVHQLIAAAAPGDAVTDQALAWQGILRDWGVEGLVIAEHVHPALEGRARRVDRSAAELRRAEGLVLHYSVWSRVVDEALAAPAPLAVCYHNVTPGDLLRPWSRALADACDRGRAALPRLAGRTAALIADSAFNARELAEAGLGEARVVPLVLDLPAAAPDPRPAGSPPAILTVGRIVPNKRIEDVVRAFALYRGVHAPDATLTLVGSDEGFASYRAALDELVARIRCGGVRFAGRVPLAERDRLYGSADAYLCMSEHEGFCAPVVEALAHGVPVVARAAAAVPETLGGAGVVVDAPDLLPLAAEALAEVVGSPATREGLAAAAALRLAELRREAVVPALRAALAPLLGAA